ncbi:MAG: hypothetical protein K8823_582 [Cenarchaeum symbiont of Oopsacas minuta]|nr:hypothetical protein [Cenarchaeum symbiont of Oopsacas minuta]
MNKSRGAYVMDKFYGVTVTDGYSVYKSEECINDA